MSSTIQNKSVPAKIISSVLQKVIHRATGTQVSQSIMDSETANKILAYSLQKLSPYHMARTLFMLQFGDKKQAIKYAIKHARKDAV